jgi:hypothetical protein
VDAIPEPPTIREPYFQEVIDKKDGHKNIAYFISLFMTKI